MNLNYNYPLFRPPAESNNIILQITLGCSYNACSFCSMYKYKKFKVRDINSIYEDINILALNYPNATKIFLADGDALAVESEFLLLILQYLNKKFIKLRRVSLYASAQNILSKSDEELTLLYENDLKLIYYGIESGNDTILKKITKGVTQSEIISSLNIASRAKIKISATIILGIGGSKYSNDHIRDTAYIVNNTTINYLSTLQLGLEEDVIDKFHSHFDDYIALDDFEILDEQKRFIELLNPINKVIFRSNHASHALHLSGTLPKDKNKLLEEINIANSIGMNALIPPLHRGF